MYMRIPLFEVSCEGDNSNRGIYLCGENQCFLDKCAVFGRVGARSFIFSRRNSAAENQLPFQLPLRTLLIP